MGYRPQIFKQLFFVLDYFPLTNQEVGILSNWPEFLKMDLRILEGFWNMEPNFLFLTEYRGLSASYHLTWVILRSNEVILRSFISLGWILLQMSDNTRR